MIQNSTYNSMLYRNCGNTRKWKVMGGSVEKWRKEKKMGERKKGKVMCYQLHLKKLSL